jgi:hypothetical protein
VGALSNFINLGARGGARGDSRGVRGLEKGKEGPGGVSRGVRGVGVVEKGKESGREM